MDHELAAWFLIALGLVGFLDSLYFVAVTYRWMRPDPPWLPPVCRMDEATCARIVDTPYGRLLGLPNSIFGLAWYGIIAGWATFWLMGGGPFPYALPFWMASLAAVLVSIVLIWALAARLRVVCTLCYFAHATNFLIFALLNSG